MNIRVTASDEMEKPFPRRQKKKKKRREKKRKKKENKCRREEVKELTLMFTPHSITWSHVMNTSQKLELVQWYLICRNSKFVMQLSDGGAADALDGCLECGASFTWDAKRM